MSTSLSVKQTKVSMGKIMSGTLMIAGTTIGAGMLGIPLVTAQSGFLPALSITLLVWFFMLCTGLLFLEISLWMPEATNLLLMSQRFLGKKGRLLVGGMFLFLYMSLMVAYFAAGAPLLAGFFQALFGFTVQGWTGYLFFGLIFGSVVALGATWIDRTNMILAIAMIFAYVLMIGTGSSEVQGDLLKISRWPAVFLALPVLFSAFGYHNVIPSLCNYLKKDRKALKVSILLGTTIPLIVYLLWQWLVIGSVPQEEIFQTLTQGLPATQAFKAKPMIYLIGQYFAFFAVVTSLLGVSFSMVDFLAEGLNFKKGRILLTFLAFFPPFLFAAIDPTIFDRALGIAGGFGEAILNGILPVTLVWIGRYVHDLPCNSRVLSSKFSLILLFAGSLFVIILEAFSLVI